MSSLLMGKEDTKWGKTDRSGKCANFQKKRHQHTGCFTTGRGTGGSRRLTVDINPKDFPGESRGKDGVGGGRITVEAK